MKIRKGHRFLQEISLANVKKVFIRHFHEFSVGFGVFLRVVLLWWSEWLIIASSSVQKRKNLRKGRRCLLASVDANRSAQVFHILKSELE